MDVDPKMYFSAREMNDNINNMLINKRRLYKK